MKKTLLLTVILVVGTLAVQAKKVLLQSAGTPSLHLTISAAVTAAQPNDTIYIPGSIFNENVTIDKPLTIFGTGHYPDSTAAPGMSQIIGTVYFNTGCDGTKLEGMYVSGELRTPSQTINNVSVLRCRVGGNVVLTGTIDGFLISESVIIGSLHSSTTGLATNILIEKTIIQGQVLNFRNTSQMSNCILLAHGSYSSSGSYSNLYDVIGMELNSNIILANYCAIPNTCVFKNNLFVYNFASSMGFDDVDNLFSQDIASIFKTLDTSDPNKFKFEYDYHLQATSPGVNAGVDGTNVGIYGTANPCKLSAVPSNPHFYKVDIASESGADGKLSVKLGVQSQER